MRMLLTLIGIIWIILGFLIFIFPDASKEVIRGLLKQKNIKTLSIISFTIGIILLLGYSVVSMPWLMIVFGIGGMLKGVFFMFAPQEKIKLFINWYLGAANNLFRSWGVAAFLFGVLILLIL